MPRMNIGLMKYVYAAMATNRPTFGMETLPSAPLNKIPVTSPFFDLTDMIISSHLDLVTKVIHSTFSPCIG